MTIWANTIVHNEENFVWFALMSVVDYVDKMLVWDTGSTDKTVEIVKEMQKKYPNKIDFKEVGKTDRLQYTKMRQAMLDRSNCDWILVLDGDEIWWNESLKKIAGEIIGYKTETEGIVVPMVVPVGDIYHFQDESAGRYKIKGRKGNFTLRVMSKKIPGLHVDLPYGRESYFDGDNVLVQERENLTFIDAPFLHVTHLKRSAGGRGDDKFKFEIGKPFPRGFKYPEVFYAPRPDIVPDPWRKISPLDFVVASLLTPLRKIKRSLFDK